MSQMQINIENIYAPNDINQQIQFFTNLASINRHEDNQINLIGGDFNITLNAIDRRNGVSGRSKVTDILEDLLQKNRLLDIWRFKNPTKRQYTWSREKGLNASRLDYLFISSVIKQNIEEVKILVAILTDHSIVRLAYNIKLKTEKGPGVWRMNDRHLQEQDYCAEIKKVIDNMKQRDVNAIQKWKDFKLQVRKISREYGKRKALQMKLEAQSLSQKMTELKNMQGEVGDGYEAYINLQSDLDEFFQEKTQQMTFQNTLNWLHKGEKNTKYFYGLEKRTVPPSGINQIYDENKQVIEDNNKIECKLREFWGNIFKHQVTQDKSILHNFITNIKQITEKTKEEINENIKLTELTDSIFSMVDDKSPGEDGITVKFY